jgi:hypothetical protein
VYTLSNTARTSSSVKRPRDVAGFASAAFGEDLLAAIAVAVGLGDTVWWGCAHPQRGSLDFLFLENAVDVLPSAVLDVVFLLGTLVLAVFIVELGNT